VHDEAARFTVQTKRLLDPDPIGLRITKNGLGMFCLDPLPSII
jgi:hypothetical protein